MTRRVASGNKIITAAEYRAWAEESLKWAREARTESQRVAYAKCAEVWLRSALQSETLGKDPTPPPEHVWVLPRFEDWRSKATQREEPGSRSEKMKKSVETKD